ncbi:hypothetical protein [Aeromicrobium sp. UC242_57]|uniref:hypothetical protein n=1 Tax=Aeromicrobium sp. UC242_57 TaxID=3374624 RepID=UPI0037AB1615
MKPPRLGDAILGVGYLVLIGVFLFVAMAAYNKTFVKTTDIKLTTGTIGNALQDGSDVSSTVCRSAPSRASAPHPVARS